MCEVPSARRALLLFTEFRKVTLLLCKVKVERAALTSWTSSAPICSSRRHSLCSPILRRPRPVDLSRYLLTKTLSVSSSF